MLTLAPDEGFMYYLKSICDCFCRYGGPETAIELVLKPGHDDFLMDELVAVTGKFKLLYDDVTSGVYRLTDAVTVKENLVQPPIFPSLILLSYSSTEPGYLNAQLI